MSARRHHPGLLEEAARELDRRLRALSAGESRRPDYLKDYNKHLHHLHAVVEAPPQVGGKFATIKKVVRKALKPFLFRQSQIDRLFIARLFDIHDELSRLGSSIDRLRDEVEERLDDVDARRASAPRGVAGPHERSEATVAIGPRAGGVSEGARLLLGSTPVPPSGFVRVDPDGGDDADLSAPLDGIPARPGSAAEIVAANVLERYTPDEIRGALLPHWATLLRPGGTLTIIADDFEAAADRLRDGLIDADGLAAAVFADGRPRRSAHTPASLRRDLDDAGFVDVTVVERAQRPDADAYGFSVRAVVPAA